MTDQDPEHLEQAGPGGAGSTRCAEGAVAPFEDARDETVELAKGVAQELDDRPGPEGLYELADDVDPWPVGEPPLAALHAVTDDGRAPGGPCPRDQLRHQAGLADPRLAADEHRARAPVA